MFKLLCFTAMLLITGSLCAIRASAQDSSAPCGRYSNDAPIQCLRPDASAYLESDCQTTGRLEACLPYHYNACYFRGMQAACRLYQMGQNCQGGDQNTCNYYVQLLRANTDCAMNSNPSACDWLRQQGFVTR